MCNQGLFWVEGQALKPGNLALRDVHKPISVATYSLTDTLPAELRPFFPSNEELVRRLDAVAAVLRG